MVKTTSKIDKGFWDNSWSHISFEKYSGVEPFLANTNKLNRLLKKFLVKGDKKILEIGCARAKQLIYFSKKYGYKISGVDLSQSGVEVAKKNIVLAGLKGDIRCEDIFQTTFEKESFDIVYSMGLVEHFDYVSDVVDAHVSMVKKDGLLIITVPNFRNSLYLAFSRLFGSRDWIMKMHNLDTMNKDIWPSMMKDKGMEVLFADYFGVLDLTLSFGMMKSKVFLYPLLGLNQILGYLTYFMPSSKYMSPYMVVIARKK